jgi:Bacterial alpha-L-rhamnosidase 6 hairpin glycosidase domain
MKKYKILMKKQLFLIVFANILGLLCNLLNAQIPDPYKEHRANWLKIAAQTEPKLVETIKHPLNIVSVEKSETAFQGWKIVPKSKIDTLYQNSLKKQSVVIVDFGEHYIKIEVLGSSIYSDFKMTDISVTSTTSVSTMPAPLASTTHEIIQKIDKIGLNTLKECMQTVYEDGTKRDRRLWIGDLYLESLANIYSFKNDSLAKHCLYLLAGLSYETGVVPSNVFERPTPHPQINPLFDYALIYNVALNEYLVATGDKQTALDLWQVAKNQVQIPKKYISEDGMMDYEKAGKEWWLFFDWRDGLDKRTALQGVVIWAYKNTYQLAKLLGKESEVAELPALIEKCLELYACLFHSEVSEYFSKIANT